jgi:hypothetical protein
MPENQNGEPQASVASLVGGIFVDAQKLVQQEIALARREVAETCDKAKTGIALLSGALAVSGVAGALFGIMLAKILNVYLLPGYEWACFGIVGVMFALPGGALAYCGYKKFSEVHLSLPQTVDTLRDDAQAVGAAVSEGRSAVGILLKR